MIVHTSHCLVEKFIIRRRHGHVIHLNLLDALLLELTADALTVGNKVVNAQLQFLHLKWFGHIFVGTNLQGIHLVRLLRLGSQQDDWQMAVVNTVLHIFHKLISVHHGHHHVGYNEVNLRFLYYLHGFSTIACGFHPVLS